MFPMDLFVWIAGKIRSVRNLNRIMRNKPYKDCRLSLSFLKLTYIDQNKTGASLAAHPLVVRHIHSLSADMVSANELVLFQLSGLLGCFSDIVG